MAKVDTEATHRFEIDPEGKYIILVPDWYKDGNPSWESDMDKARKAIKDWWNNKDDYPFLVMPDSFKLVRVDEPEEVDSWYEEPSNYTEGSGNDHTD